MKKCLPLAYALLVALSTMGAQAQTYPVKPIRFIIPYPPAGTTDFVGREVSSKLSEYLGQQVIIDNRPGAGTLIGLTQGARAPADGYTVTFGTSSGLAIYPALGAKMPFDPQRDFVAVGTLAYTPFFLVINPSLPVRNIKELIELARAQPGKINFASPGVGTPNHLGIEMLNQLGGVKFVHVPYKGGAQAITDLIAGQVQAFFSGTPQFSAFTKSGRLRIIATATPKPNRIMPDMPTVAETYPGFDCNTWYGILMPAGAPAAAVTRFGTELNRALTDPGVVQRLLDQGIEAMPGSAATLRQMIVSETERWRKVIKAAGITIEAVQ